MINNEILEFVRNQLKANIPKEQIIIMLKSNGWNDTDISEAFAYLNTPQPNKVPIPQVPTGQNIVQEPDTSKTGSYASFMNPKFGRAFWIMFLSVAMCISFVLINPELKIILAMMPDIGLTLLFLIILPVMTLGLLFVAMFINLSTRIFRVPERSFAKAMIFISSTLAFSSVLGLSTNFFINIGIIGIIIIALINIIFPFWFLSWYYKIGIFKSIGVYLLGILMIIAIGVVPAIILASINSAKNKNVLPITQDIQEKSSTESNQTISEQGDIVESESQNIDSWKEYSYATENFSVKFPANPDLTEKSEKMEGGPLIIKIFESSVSANSDTFKYNVEYLDIPDVKFKPSDTKEIREAKGMVFYGIMLKFAYGNYVEISGSEDGKILFYEIKAPDKYMKGRVVANNDKVYSYGSECSKCTTMPNLDAFLTSFKLLK